MNRAEVLVEALPYIQKFSGKTFVIKYGGSIMENDSLKKKFIEDIALLKLVGINIVIVHGGGKRINAMLDRSNLDIRFEKGQRVTDENVMQIVEMVLSGDVNKDLSACLASLNIKAIGISGRDGGLLKAEKKIGRNPDGTPLDLGMVGNVKAVNSEFLQELIADGFVPVISPVASGFHPGEVFNVNADYAAGAIAGALKAEKLFLLSDIRGLYRDVSDEGSFISAIDVESVRQMIRDGEIAGGMIPKMECCMYALKQGAEQVAIIDGRVEHNLLLELFTNAGSGTMVTR